MNTLRIEKPIFIIGMGRSGTTVVFEALASHQDLGWLSNYSRLFPTFPHITTIHRLFLGLRGQKRQWNKVSFVNKLLPKPAEAYPVWEYLLGREFSYSFLRQAKPGSSDIEKTHQFLKQLLKWEGKTRFCAKLTGPPRIRFLSQIFNDAFFIDIVRDPRAVVSSLISADFWKEKGGLKGPFWYHSLDDEALEIWKEAGDSPVVLASLLYREVYQTTEQERQSINSRYCRVHYEHFIEDPLLTMNGILSFCGLERSEKVSAYICSVDYKNMNYKFWQKLSASEIKEIERITGDQMRELGYSD
jgi:hypothetical protein